jgi:hypothetical protein
LSLVIPLWDVASWYDKARPEDINQVIEITAEELFEIAIQATNTTVKAAPKPLPPGNRVLSDSSSGDSSGSSPPDDGAVLGPFDVAYKTSGKRVADDAPQLDRSHLRRRRGSNT